jgi:hypothetical protein
MAEFESWKVGGFAAPVALIILNRPVESAIYTN